MKVTNCNQCHNDAIPISETVLVDTHAICKNCFEEIYPDKPSLAGKKVEAHYDPTVCSSCGLDNGDVAFSLRGRFPVCEPCTEAISRRIFPGWVKLFFICVLVITAFAFLWNLPFYLSFRDFKKANEAFGEQRIEKAAELMRSASDRVPEVAEMRGMADYFKGIDMLAKNNSEAALQLFYKAHQNLPSSFSTLDQMILLAKMGVSFDQKNYPGFLEAANENLSMDSSVARSWASVASAYACLYVTNNSDSAKKMADIALKKAMSIDSSDADLKSYYNMIAYRLDAHEIINRSEFEKRFPHGWIKN